MNSVLLLFFSVVLFSSYTLLLVIENKKNDRILLSTFRLWVDKLLSILVSVVKIFFAYVEKFFFQLGIRTILHVLLRRILLSIAALYDMLMSYFEYNRRQRKLLKKIKADWSNKNSFLTQLQAEKEHTALSDKEKTKRKMKAINAEYYY